jgi:F-type H+-transporting ATPase subunit b
MTKMNWMKRLTLLALFALLFSVIPAALAQEATPETPAGEHGGETGGEGDTTTEEAVSPLEPLGINTGYLIAQLINFGIVFGGLTFLIWGPATKMLDARAATIQKGLEDSAAAAKARMNAEQDASKVLADAQSQAAKIIAEARATGEKLAKDEETRGKQAAEKTRSDAEVEARGARDAALAGMRDQVIGVSVALAQRIINSNLDAKKQSDLVSDFFSKLPASAKGLSGKVEVVSAMPLSDAEQKKAKSQLGDAEVSFAVDPSILGGIVVRSADKVIDGSVKSNLNELAGSLN